MLLGSSIVDLAAWGPLRLVSRSVVDYIWITELSEMQATRLCIPIMCHLQMGTQRAFSRTRVGNTHRRQ